MQKILVFIVAIWATAGQADIRFGVLAPQGEAQAQARWQMMIGELAQSMGEQIELVPLVASDVAPAMDEGRIDVLLANPVQSAVAADKQGAKPMASMISSRGDRFAGVIIVRSDSDILSLQDLPGHRFASLSDHAAGGYLFQSAHMVMNGIGKPDTIGARLLGKNQNVLVEMLLAGEADVAFVRTGVVEDLTAKGVIPQGAIRVIGDKKASEGGFHRSTKWYPEWFLMAHPKADRQMLDMLLVKILNLDPKSPGAKAAKLKGFQMPLDLSGVTLAMQAVGVAPYN